MLQDIALATLGGALIGAAASAMMIGIGRIMGISGIVGGLLTPSRGDWSWRATFVLGVIVGALILLAFYPGYAQTTLERSTLALVGAGFLVGLGASLGSGCTSGHGVCGISRLSARSLVATITFMATGMLTVYIVQHVWGGNL